MNETKSKALLIVSLIAILAVSSTVVVWYTFYAPEHLKLEVLRVEMTEEGSNVLLLWYGNETEMKIVVQAWHAFGWGLNRYFISGYEEWNSTVRHGSVFNVFIPCYHWSEIYFYDVELRLDYAGHLWIRDGIITELYNPHCEPLEFFDSVEIFEPDR